MRTLLIMFLLALVGTDGFCQNGKEVFMSILKKYNSSVSFSTELDINYYENGVIDVESTMKRCKIIKSGDKYYSRFGDIEIINVEAYMINVDKQEKQIYIADFQEIPNVLSLPEVMDTYADYSFKVSVDSNNTNKLKIGVHQNNVRSIEMSYNPKTYQLIKTVIHYEVADEYENNKIDKTDVEVIYRNQLFSDKITNAKEFKVASYFTIDGTMIKPSSTYSTYSIVNLIEKK